MEKIKLLLLMIIGSICCPLSYAQQVYQAGHYGEPGDLYLYNRLIAGFSNEGLTQSGADVTWDLTANANLATHPVRIVEPAQGINQFTFLAICVLGGFTAQECFGIWNNTDQALLLQDTINLLQFSLTNLQRYHNKTANSLLENFFGFTVDLGGTPTSAVIVYQNPDTIINFPVTYGDAWTSQINFALDLSATGQNIIYKSNQSRTTEIDSWGTIYTPYDTFENVVRLRSEIFRLDTIIADTIILPVSLTQVEYMWFDTNYTLPVMTANGIVILNDSTIINSVEYIYEATCPAPTWSVDTGLDTFYIGPSGTVTVGFTLDQSNANTYMWDFGDGTFATSEGDVVHDYSIPGHYTVAVNGCMTNCLPLNSCSFQLIEFDILDTLSSITTISGNELGIKLFPNPVQELLQMIIPAELGSQHYRILDVSGREVIKGRLPSGHVKINTGNLATGPYVIQLWSGQASDSRLAFLRFMVTH